MFKNNDICIKDNVLYLRDPRVRIPFEYIKSLEVISTTGKDKLIFRTTNGYEYTAEAEAKDVMKITYLLTK